MHKGMKKNEVKIIKLNEVKEDDILALCIIIVRYIIQLVRLFATLKQARMIRQSLKSSHIRFDINHQDSTTDHHEHHYDQDDYNNYYNH